MTLKKHLLYYGGIIIFLFLFHFIGELILTHLQKSELHSNEIANQVVVDMNDLLILSMEGATYNYSRIQDQWVEKFSSLQYKIDENPDLSKMLKAEVESLKNTVETLQNLHKRKITISPDSSETISRIKTMEDWLQNKMQLDSRAIVSKSVILSKRTSKKASQLNDLEERTTLIILILILGIVVFSTYNIVKVVIVPLTRLLRHIKSIETGNISQNIYSELDRVNFNKTKEIYHLSEAFEHMALSLLGILDKLEAEIEQKNRINQKLLLSNEKLTESEAQFRSLIEQSGDAMYLSDFDGNIISVNKKACETLGYEQNELVQLNISDIDINFVNKDDQKQLWADIVPGESQMLETKHKCKDGQLIPVEVTFGLYEFSHKKSILGFARNITERKAAEKILQKSQSELLEAQRIGRLGSWYLDLATNEVVWTKELYRMYNFDPTFPPPPLTEHQKLFTAESWNRLSKAIAKTRETGIPYELELETIRNDGSNGWMWTKGEPVRDANGVIIGLRGAAQNITERKQFMQKLLERENLLNDTQQLTKNGGWRWNVKNQTMFWTKETYRIHEIDPYEIEAGSDEHIQLGINCYNEKDRQTISEAFEKCRDEGIPYNFETHFTTVKGNRLWIRTTARAEKESSEIVGVIGNIMNITERKMAEEELTKHRFHLEEIVEERTTSLAESQEALLNLVDDLNIQSKKLEKSNAQFAAINKELETFTYSVSHDLKAPLRGIDGYSKLLLDLHKPSLNEEAQTFIDTIRRSTLQMNQLINDLLDYSRLERSQLSIELIKVKDLIKSVVSIYNADLKTSNFKIKMDIADIELFADSKGLTIAIRNLLENAIKFTRGKAEPTIQIKIDEKDISWIISVNDNGIGFDMKYSQKIFDIFQRLQRTEDFPGTGIGLAMVSKAMHRMHGRAWAQSAPGMGSTFYLEIPKNQ